MKKILYYNWIQFDDSKNRGGGVTLYQRNVMDALKDNSEYELYFLSAGRDYSLRRNPYVVKTKNNLGEKCKSYKIINSTILAPSYYQFYDVSAYYNDTKMYNVFKRFVDQYGPFDVIHFNNMEGLPFNVLKIKEDYPNTKIIYSVHNYFAFCPQVGLWYKDHKNCMKEDFNNGEGCTDCSAYINRKAKRTYGMVEYLFTKLGLETETKLHENVTRVFRLPDIIKHRVKKADRAIQKYSTADEYVRFRQENVDMLNKYADCVVAVSDRVGEITKSMGVLPEKVKTLYIGTKFAAKQLPGKVWNGDVLNLIYLGYPRSDKGFWFLMEALRALDDELAKKINVTFATKTDDQGIIDYINSINTKFNKVTWINGYTHENLNDILKEQDLGVVPVLWEDNLPQVAIEMAANGVPVLSSDLGGAKELSDSTEFVFKNGDVKDFESKIRNIIESPNVMKKYWDGYHKLKTMEDHIAELEEIYN